jgi:uncharacterized RDD family membrane protein YckC
MSVAPGWYPDPASPQTQRYWDGEQWIGPPIPAGAPTPSEPPPPPPVLAPKWPEDPVPVPVAPSAPAPPASGGQLATPLRRLAARLLDITIVFGLVALVNSYFFAQFFAEVSPQIQSMLKSIQAGDTTIPMLQYSDRAVRLNIIMALISAALWFAYEVPATANTGQTLGKRVAGIRVKRIDGQSLTFGLAFRRWLVLALPNLLPGSCGILLQALDTLWCTWDRPLYQCLHDKFVNTVVVTVPPVPTGASPADVPGPADVRGPRFEEEKP